jgi:hypothetical protein
MTVLNNRKLVALQAIVYRGCLKRFYDINHVILFRDKSNFAMLTAGDEIR